MSKAFLKRLLGDKLTGKLEYLLKPSLKESWGGPMNGQSFRRAIYEDLLASLPLKAIVETGTFRGTTTEYFAASNLPVYTVEANPRFYEYSRLRLRHVGEHVHRYKGDSRDFLRRLSGTESMPKSDVYFYLDAHWEEDLPLREEIQIIFAHWERAVVMVDDFAVPGSTYAYDDYGGGKELTMAYLEPLEDLGLQAYFPSIPAEQETGARRGCVVLCADPVVADALDKLETLVRHEDLHDVKAG